MPTGKKKKRERERESQEKQTSVCTDPRTHGVRIHSAKKGAGKTDS